MTISYPIEKFEADDGDVIHLIWNSDCTWLIEKPDLGNCITVRCIDFDPILKGEEFEFNSGMFGWLYTIKPFVVDGRLKIEEWVKMWSNVPSQLRSTIDISVADFEKCKEITIKDKQTKPVHYCNPDGSIVFDPSSFKDNDEESA